MTMMTKSRNLLRRDCKLDYFWFSGVPASCSRGVANESSSHLAHSYVWRMSRLYSKTGDWIEDSDEEIAELDRREAAAEQARLAALVPPLILGGSGGTP